MMIVVKMRQYLTQIYVFYYDKYKDEQLNAEQPASSTLDEPKSQLLQKSKLHT